MSQKKARLPLMRSAQASMSRIVAELRRFNFIVAPVKADDLDKGAVTVEKLSDQALLQIMVDGW